MSMALNFSVSYQAGSTSLLVPSISLPHPQQFADAPMRLVIDMTGFSGKLMFDPVHGVITNLVDGIYTFDGQAILMNRLLSTLKYSPSSDGQNVGNAQIDLYEYVDLGTGAYKNIMSGRVVFATVGFGSGQDRPLSRFTPKWVSSENLGSISTDQNFSFTVKASMNAIMLGEEIAYFGNDRAIVVPPSYSNANVTRNGAPLLQGGDYVRQGDVLRFMVPLRDDDIVNLNFDANLIYQRIHTDFPIILGGGQSGYGHMITGILPSGGMAAGQVTSYRVGMRAIGPNAEVSDRTFIIQATSTSNLQHPTWSIDTPDFVGSYTRGSPISFEIGVHIPVGSFGDVVQSDTGALVDEEFRGLPAGVSVSSTGVISGVIDPSTALGLHFFRLSLRDAENAEVSYREFSLLVNSPVGSLEPLRFIRWITPSGSLGAFKEGEKCPISVRAGSTTSEPVRYSLVPVTATLPEGIRLNAYTGDFEGVFGHAVGATVDVVHQITVRASIGNTFVDRDFSITVTPRYHNFGATDVHLRIRNAESRPMVESYSAAITDNDYFRPEDSNFGRVSSPLIYIVGGLSKAYDADPNEGPDRNAFSGNEYVAEAIRTSNFGGPIELRLGKHKIAKVRAGNQLLYEVLYREVYDPLELAGGFTMNQQGVPARQTLIHPQSNSPFYPESITNFRNDLILQVGFDSFTPSLNLVGGIGGPENLPAWMFSPQTASAESAIGFVPAVTIAYLKPNAGARVLERLAIQKRHPTSPLEDANPLADNHGIWFNQFYLTYTGNTDATTFDGDNTTFDIGLTTFDDRVTQEGKYQRMNPKGR